ncbi:acyl-CoA thioesterase [Bdellovibrio svalbardensis]|uniref:Acyl-CoA thioesterase n=1 Tax=Bdellovibrio svalbardensis TaxID=2972972 RepID=A0ABT6DSU3_9BACT|nr:acyl-CoA thioesterase [Bdellovibrio svalbardensis]MDG0818223.1 acyl-CoA thioesterase [Bdellovibrio svalbardensis]
MAAPKNAKSVASSQVIMTQLVLPSHTNALGSVFGGTIMSWIDIAAAIAAQRHSNKEVVTASIDRLDFVAPVYKGWVVNLHASVNFTSRTSMEVGVRVDAENPKTGEMFHTASAYTTFVALGSNGKPADVPELILETEDDKRRFSEAKERRANRLRNRPRSNDSKT